MPPDQTATLQEIVSRLDALQTSMDELLVLARPKAPSPYLPVHNGNDESSVESDADWVGPCRTKNCGHDEAAVLGFYQTMEAGGVPIKALKALFLARFHTREAIAAAEDRVLMGLMGGIGGWNGLKKIRAWQERAGEEDSHA